MHFLEIIRVQKVCRKKINSHYVRTITQSIILAHNTYVTHGKKKKSFYYLIYFARFELY